MGVFQHHILRRVGAALLGLTTSAAAAVEEGSSASWVTGQAMRYDHEVGMGQDVAGPGTLRFADTVHDIWLTRVRLYTNWKATWNIHVDLLR